MKLNRYDYAPNFKIPELELWYRRSKLYFLTITRGELPYKPFTRYKEGIRYIYAIVENNEIELQLESYLSLIKECRKIGVLDGSGSK